MSININQITSNIINCTNNNNLNIAIKNIDFNQLSLKNVKKIVNSIVKNNKIENITLDLDSIIYMIDNIKNDITYHQIIDYSIFNIFHYVSNNDDYRLIIEYLLKNRKDSSFLDYFFEDGTYYFFNIDENLLKDKDIIETVYKIVKNNLNQFNSHIKDHLYDKSLLSNSLLRELYNRYNKEIEKSLLELNINTDFLDLFSIDIQFKQGKNFNEIVDSLSSKDVNEIIIEYFNQVNDNSIFLENINNKEKFLLNFNNYIKHIENNKDNNNIKSQINSLKEYLIIFKSIYYDLNDDLNNIINMESYNYKNIIKRLSIIRTSSIEKKDKITKMGLLFLKLFSEKNIDKQYNFNNFFRNRYGYINSVAIVYTQEIIKNIDKLPIKDKAKFSLLKTINNINKELYSKLYNESIEYIKDIKSTIEEIDI